MTEHARVLVRPEVSTIRITGLARAKQRRVATVLYDALRDWLERQRLVDAGLLPSGRLRPVITGIRGTLAVRGVPIARISTASNGQSATGSTLDLFLPPYVQGVTALEAAREVVKVLHKSGLAQQAVVDTGEDHGQHAA